MATRTRTTTTQRALNVASAQSNVPSEGDVPHSANNIGDPDLPSNSAQPTQPAPLAQNEVAERLDGLLEISADGLSDWNLANTTMYLSPRWLQIMDYPPDACFPVDVADLFERVHAEDRDHVLAEMNECFMGEQSRLEIEYRIVRRDGEVRWVHTRGLVRRGTNGIPVRFICSLRDVTARREANDKLRDSEERVRMLSDVAPVMLWMSDADGRYLFANRAMLDFVGMHGQALTTADWLRAVQAEDRHFVRTTFMQASSRQESFNLEFGMRRVDGELRNVLCSGVPRWSLQGSFIGYVGSCVDITERKAAERRLRESESLYRTVFESVSDGLRLSHAQTDETIEVNAAWCQMHGYTRDEAMRLSVADFVSTDGMVLFPTLWLDTVRAGGNLRGQSVNRRKDGTKFPVDVRAQRATSHGHELALAVVRDVTEQVQAMDLLERRVEERTRELSRLLAATQVLSSTLDLRTVLQLVVDQLSAVVEHKAINLFMVEPPDTLRLVAFRGASTEQLRPVFDRWQFTRADYKVVQTRRPMLISDLGAAEPNALEWIEDTSQHYDPNVYDIRSWMAIPLIVRNEVVGVLTLMHERPNYFSQAHVELVQAFANQAAAAISNASLYEAGQRRLRESERRRVVAEGLRDVMRVLNSSLALSETLEFILTCACGLLNTQTAVMYKLDPVSSRMTVQVARGLDDGLVGSMSMPIGKGPAGRAATLRQPFIADDLSALTQEDFADSPEQLRELEAHADSLKCALAVPLMIKDEIYGALLLLFPERREFSTEDIELMSVIGDQAALAIENARLRIDSARVAAVAERSRLARELHDSVSQALYGIALGARTARELVDNAPQRAAEPLDYVLTLVQGGLSEMRALIFELRPESLATEGLLAAFKKQADALCARHGIDVVLENVTEPNLDLDAKEALYRIALEAIQNTIKHAHATRVTLRLTTQTDHLARPIVRLEIADNGRGFNPVQTFPGHIGLQSMRERAESMGGQLSVHSEPLQGTQVVAVLPANFTGNPTI